MKFEHIYLLPGLGLDDRIFDRLELPDLEIHYLNWLKPLSLNESLQSYAQRMAEGIDTSQEEIVLIGHSFGGILAQEIARLIPIRQIILISSIKSRKENPLIFKLVGKLGLYHLMSRALVTRTFFLWGALYGYSGGAEQRLLEDMFRKNSNLYLRWALKQLAFWNPEPGDTPLVHIHGTRDRTFPLRKIKPPVIPVRGGWHFMVYQKPKEISELLMEQLPLNPSQASI